MDIGTFKASVGHNAAFWPVLITKATSKHGLRDTGSPQDAGLSPGLRAMWPPWLSS